MRLLVSRLEVVKRISFLWNPGLLAVLVFSGELHTIFLSRFYLNSKRFGIADVSNERSMHSDTTKRSGGIWIFLPVFCLAGYAGLYFVLFRRLKFPGNVP
ncbi:hypothetical protein LEP1GSC060_0386 [Leptospira weilii serovar Ranarum str. ICFT]|uniref:Uncharacterized protein n=1 Tax=Leptospira weilii serovar Ranarum str. ICFT TaxID=1218598 RepID=N1WHJ0_9LEPT|nr:hypothetical protein LEP1GSC060_0386 [Leptospira weilii serovar Ranarum str. ICFT]